MDDRFEFHLRRIIGVPDDWDGLAWEWVEQEAEKALVEEECRTVLANRLVYSGRSQGDLARFLDVSQPTVSRLVKGQAPVSRFRAERLAEFLGGKPDDYMTAEADEGGMSVEIPLDTYMGYLIRAVILTGHPGTTLKDVADSVGMTQRELAGWARGDFEVSESIAQRLLMRWLPGWAS